MPFFNIFRCPLSRAGVACQIHSNPPQALSSSAENMAADPFATYMLVSVFLMAAMVLFFFVSFKFKKWFQTNS